MHTDSQRTEHNTEYRIQNTENRKQKTENRKQKTENRKQKTENRKQKTENRIQNIEICEHKITNVTVFYTALGLNDFDQGKSITRAIERDGT
jgi:hypothetical protein